MEVIIKNEIFVKASCKAMGEPSFKMLFILSLLNRRSFFEKGKGKPCFLIII